MFKIIIEGARDGHFDSRYLKNDIGNEFNDTLFIKILRDRKYSYYRLAKQTVLLLILCSCNKFFIS